MSRRTCIPAASLHAIKMALWAAKLISRLLLPTPLALPAAATSGNQMPLAVLPFSCLLAVAGFAVAVQAI